jgi:hypothetical protein
MATCLQTLLAKVRGQYSSHKKQRQRQRQQQQQQQQMTSTTSWVRLSRLI